jgi:CCR4-NOT transcription complex subunit 4
VTASTSASNTRRDRDKERDRDREVRRTTATTTRGARSEARSSTSTVTARPREERKASSTKTPSASRPSTPALSTVPARITTPGTETGTTKATRKKEPAPEPVSEPAPASPAVPTAVPVEPIPALKSPVVPKETPNVDTPPIVAASPVVTPAAPPGLPVAPPGLPAAPPSLPAAPPGLPAIPPGLPAVPPGLSAVPPGLSLPPGLSVPKALVEPITPQISSSSSYTMSTQARALLDDVKARREQPAPVAQAAPFPDLDRTLQVLSAGSGEAGGFAFSLDTGLAEELGGPAGADGAAGSDIPDLSDLPELPDYAVESDLPFAGSFMAAFPGIKPSSYVGNGFVGVPPGLAMGAGMEFQHAPNRSIYDPRPPIPERQSTAGSNYTGSFNPFGDSSESLSQPSQPSYQSQPSPMLGDEDRKTSRFGFARGRQGSATPSVASTSSPLQALAQPDLSGLSAANAPTPFYSTHATNSPAMSSWSARPEYAVPPGQGQGQGQGRGTVGISRTASPFAHASQVSSGPQPFAPQPSRHLYDHGVTEAQLRDLMRSSTTPAPGRSMGLCSLEFMMARR